MKTVLALLSCIALCSCATEAQRWLPLKASIVNEEVQGDGPALLVIGEAPDGPPVEEEIDTGLGAGPSTPTTAHAVLVTNVSDNPVCYLHVHGCDVEASVEKLCGAATPGTSSVVPVADILGRQSLEPNAWVEMWLEADCVRVFAVDCTETRCADPGELDTTQGVATVLLGR